MHLHDILNENQTKNKYFNEIINETITKSCICLESSTCVGDHEERVAAPRRMRANSHEQRHDDAAAKSCVVAATSRTTVVVGFVSGSGSSCAG